MRSGKVGTIEPFLNPDAALWLGTNEETVELIPAPLELQPNDYIKVSWDDRSFGQTSRLHVASVHDGRRVAFRLRWTTGDQSRGEGESFADGVAIAFPVHGDPILTTMGSAEAPIHALQWSARNDQLRSVLATGIGSSREGPEIGASAGAAWADGTWRVVVARPLAAPEGAARLAPGSIIGIGFALWRGANQERAGIKAYSIDWLDLALEQ